MLNQPQITRMLAKLRRFEDQLSAHLFTEVDTLNVKVYEVDRQYHEIPDLPYEPLPENFTWGGDSHYLWLRSSYEVPAELAGQDLFIMPKMGGYEAMLWVDGVPAGTFNTKIVFTGHGNHYCDLLVQNPAAGQKIDIAIEYYAGHEYQGCDPFSTMDLDFTYSIDGVSICTKDPFINEFYFDLKTVNQLAQILPETDFFRGRVIQALTSVHEVLYYAEENTDAESFRAALVSAHPFLKLILAEKNSASAPSAALIGHSHMDTAWLWPVKETIKKCARTYSNEVRLMEQYPEYKFVQSSSCHSDMIRRYYPDLFKEIQEKVAEGRYEPNGGVWVECDCNITGGESMIRQFLWGQRFTRKYFNYTSDCFWLPDTFGYSAAIPQIMKSCGVDYFLTTKMTWNDTNTFPYDTFYWQGIDGTQVLSHFNTSHAWPDAETVLKEVKALKQPTVNDSRLIAFGFGDGGGGPQFEMIEMARRIQDLNGIPKTETKTVSSFMKETEAKVTRPNVHRGELYLELHRGTLTNQHEIKHNMRKGEIALHDLELLQVQKAVLSGASQNNDSTHDLYETLLINQFHDLLPGTCIASAHTKAKEDMTRMIAEAKKRSCTILSDLSDQDSDTVTLINTTAFARKDVAEIPFTGKYLDGSQLYKKADGTEVLLFCPDEVPALGSATFRYQDEAPAAAPFCTLQDQQLTTPFYKAHLNENGFIDSLIDLRTNRQLVCGMPLGTLLMAEDVSLSWDNWDIDADIELKFHPTAELLRQEIVSAGPVALVLRNEYRISKLSAVTQDVIFYANSPEIRYDTTMNWQDDHRFLKAAFEVNVRDDFARQEIQFGNCKRPTTRNTSIEQAKFEVTNHKYTDVSEPRYGIALLNDSKYGISCEAVPGGTRMALSLHKGGTRPDLNGDHGIHNTVYSLYPHEGSYGAESVIRPAYELNYAYQIAAGKVQLPELASVDQPNVVIETIKPCEDDASAFILRLYEAEGSTVNTNLTLCDQITKVEITNMLEETQAPLESTMLEFRPFEIKTLKCYY